MDVVCGRCRAEYEFDDALISERGTTVRCTKCGLQFKVFPPVGLRAPEVWLVFDPRDERVEPIRYDSLREMQKDIARGVVTANHLLGRGDGALRPLREIVELQPLLQQPQSEPPPPVEFESAGPVPPPPAGMKTVLGVAQRPDPANLSDAPSPPRPPQDSFREFDDHAVVPAQASDPHIPITPSRARDAKPRIRSALSTSPPATQSSGATTRDDRGVDLDESDARGSIPPPRQSLRSTLVGSSTSQRPSPLPGESGLPAVGSRIPDPDPEGGPELVFEKPRASEKSVPPASRSASDGGTLPIKPTSSPSEEYVGQLTPTPIGMRAYGAPDADPVRSVAGVHVKQGARTGGIVVAVLVGAAAFLSFANRDKLSATLSDARPEKAEAPVPVAEIPSDLAFRLEMADAAWISALLLKNPESTRSAPKDDELKKLGDELSALGITNSWEKVNLLRASGNFKEARTSAGSLEKGPEQSYALALLDLAEGEDDPPWPVVLERLREAASGERGRFLARSAYIYSLTASGALPRARADFEALGQLAGGKEAPLYDELQVYLERVGAFEDVVEDSGVTNLQELEEETSEPDQDEGDPAGEATREDSMETAEKAQDEAAEKVAERSSSSGVSAATKAQVAEADAMWRGGNQEGALVIYKQVVAKIGTKHFLGQRSAARIAQAERERASAQ